MELTLYQVDAFTNKPFAGNPAGVCILPSPREAGWMQQVAQEMNLSETAFLHKRNDGFQLRWFTPTVEVDLCGHATLASAHVLWETGTLPLNQIARFHTKSGILTTERDNEWLELDFPLLTERKIDAPKKLATILGAKPTYVGKNRMDYLVEVASEDVVKKMTPNLTQLAKLPCRGVIVTAKAAHRPFDFVSRFFAPRVGVDEDPATGSSHCCLGPYWRRQLGKSEFLAQQLSSRGGIIRVKVGDKRVKIGGQAITVFQMQLRD